MRRRAGAAAILLTLAVASAGAIAATGGGGAGEAAKKKPIEYEDHELFIETNATDGDAGLQMFLDGEDWDEFRLIDPKGREVMMRAQTDGSLRGWGLTELFWEAAEPEFGETPFGRFKKRFPEGRYRFRGTTVEGRKLVGSDRLSHLIPDGPVITSPTTGEVVDPDDFTVSWEPVTTPAGVEIERYVVIVVQETLGRELSVDLAPEATSLSVPPEFLSPDPDTKVEVLARDVTGNQTITEVPFKLE